LHKGQGSPNEFEDIQNHLILIKLCLFYGIIFIFYDIFCFTMSIINLKVSISCNDIINAYNKKIINFYIVSLLEFIIKE